MHRVKSTSPRQTGLSLIELMIAMLVGLILIAGVISVFLSSRKSYGINTAVGQIQEHGRFALDFIRHTARQAGYLSCGVSGLNFTNQLNPTAALPYSFATAITGFEYNGTAPGAPTYTIASENPGSVAAGNWLPAPGLDPSLPTSGAAYAIPGSDVLAISMSVGALSPAYVVPASISGAVFDINVNTGLTAGDILVVSNCVNTVVVQATNVTGGGTHIVANTGGLFTPGNMVHGIPANMGGAQVQTANVVAYYVGEGADGAPALFQATTNSSVASGFQLQELVPGVENMQVLYGVDATGAGTPSEYDTADVVTTNGLWGSVMSVRVSLLLRSDTGAVTLPPAAVTYNLLGTVIAAPVDTRLRQTFTTTISLRNNLPNP